MADTETPDSAQVRSDKPQPGPAPSTAAGNTPVDSREPQPAAPPSSTTETDPAPIPSAEAQPSTSPPTATAHTPVDSPEPKPDPTAPHARTPTNPGATHPPSPPPPPPPPSPPASKPPTHLYLAFPGGTAVWVLHATPAQHERLLAATPACTDYRSFIALVAAQDGAALHADLNRVPEATAYIAACARGIPERRADLLAWPSGGGVWVLESPSAEQWAVVNAPLGEEGAEAGEAGETGEVGEAGEVGERRMEREMQRYCGRLQKAGATFYHNPEDSEVARVGMRQDEARTHEPARVYSLDR